MFPRISWLGRGATGMLRRVIAEHASVLPRRKLHQVVFVLAGFYNIAWGLYSSVDPQRLFRFAAMPPSNTPEIFACMAAVGLSRQCRGA